MSYMVQLQVTLFFVVAVVVIFVVPVVFCCFSEASISVLVITCLGKGEVGCL